MPASRRRRLIVVLVASALAAGGCAAAGPGRADPSPAAPGARRPAASSAVRPAAPSRSDPATAGFTVRGTVPVVPNPSQDTHAQDPAAACQPQQLRHDQALGQATVFGFVSAGAPAAAVLLTHFLEGRGTAVNFGAGSATAREARASRAFRRVNRRIQATVLGQLRAGTSQVRLTEPALRTIRFGSTASPAARDLYFGFRGTQGLDIRGTGAITGHRYTGRLTYVIRDSYGFPPQDRLLGIGTAMRYLQTDCGRPPTHGGAHWFPDSITVTVPLRRRA
jgi:hypothetical protein